MDVEKLIAELNAEIEVAKAAIACLEQFPISVPFFKTNKASSSVVSLMAAMVSSQVFTNESLAALPPIACLEHMPTEHPMP
jgi:hypothetical protein